MYVTAKRLWKYGESYRAMPDVGELFYTPPGQWVYIAAELRDKLRAIKQAIPGVTITKNYNGEMLTVTVSLDDFVLVNFWTNRTLTCTRRQVGTRTVTEPAPDAPMITREEPVYEWECAPVMDDATGV